MNGTRRALHVIAGLILSFMLFQVGARSVGAQSASNPEVAIRTGVVANGETIPLPTYHDGTEAEESECQWTVSWHSYKCGIVCTSPCATGGGAPLTELNCFTSGRTLTAMARHSCSPGTVFEGRANYLIIANRDGAPVPASRQTLGSVRTRWNGQLGNGPGAQPAHGNGR